MRRNIDKQLLEEDLTASYDPYSFLNSTRSLLLDDLKNTQKQTALQVKRSKQLNDRLNKFIQVGMNNKSSFMPKNRSPFDSKYSTDKNQSTKMSKQNCQQQNNQKLQQKMNQLSKKRNYRPSLVDMNIKKQCQSDQDDNYGQQDENKRNIIYQHQNCKEKFDNLTESDFQKQNKILKMFFSKNHIMSQTLSTSSSDKKKRKAPQGLSPQDFQIGRKIGAGKSGQVFLSRNKETGFLCAIKKIKKINVDPKTFTQLIRQIKIQSYLDHPNIVKLYAFFSDQEYIYLILQYCASGDLYSLLKKSRKMSQSTVQNLIRQVCKAVQYMHQHNILHRDIKPQNILFHNVRYEIFRDWLKYVILDGQSVLQQVDRLSVVLLYMYHHSYQKEITIAIKLMFGAQEFYTLTYIWKEGDLIKIVQDEIKFSKHLPISPHTKLFIQNCLQKDPSNRQSVSELLENPFLFNQHH